MNKQSDNKCCEKCGNKLKRPDGKCDNCCPRKCCIEGQTCSKCSPSPNQEEGWESRFENLCTENDIRWVDTDGTVWNVGNNIDFTDAVLSFIQQELEKEREEGKLLQSNESAADCLMKVLEARQERDQEILAQIKKMKKEFTHTYRGCSRCGQNSECECEVWNSALESLSAYIKGK